MAYEAKTKKKKNKKEDEYTEKTEDESEDEELTEDAQERKLVEKILARRDEYQTASSRTRHTWTKIYRAYRSSTDESRSKFLANLFIPKTHESVELLSAFLVGPNQSISASAEGSGDTVKALLVEKMLLFLWRKVLNARDNIMVWVKQAILFGNGVMKVTWDPDKKNAVINVISISDIYFDFYHRNLQESPWVIHRIIRHVDDVKEDERYDEAKRKLVVGGGVEQDEQESKFSAHDSTVETVTSDTVELLECWSLERVVTIAPTSAGMKIIRDIENPHKDSDGNKFMPFVKLRFKTNPLPNRAYDTGAIEPTLKLQLAFNDAINEFFDNVTLINNKGWIKRRGAGINPQDLVRKPGFIIEVGNINEDIRSEEVSDVKPSLIELIKFLDEEFQQASMVTNILKGVPGADFASEIAAGQANVQTLLDSIDQNIKEGLSELGQMILEVTLANVDKINVIKVLSTDEQVIFLKNVKAKELSGKYDVKIQADRSSLIPRAVRQKQMVDFAALISRDPITLQKYPTLLEKVYKRWLQNAGESDLEYFFQKAEEGQQPMMPPNQMSGMGTGSDYAMPRTNQGLTPESIMKSVGPNEGTINRQI